MAEVPKKPPAAIVTLPTWLTVMVRVTPGARTEGPLLYVEPAVLPSV